MPKTPLMLATELALGAMDAEASLKFQKGQRLLNGSMSAISGTQLGVSTRSANSALKRKASQMKPSRKSKKN